MGRNCALNKGNNNVECSVPLEKQVADGKLWNIRDMNTDLIILQMTIKNYSIVAHLFFLLICRGRGN
jgi:hypothetical protein